MGYATGILHRIESNIYAAYRNGDTVENLAKRYEVSESKIKNSINKAKERQNNIDNKL